MTHAKQIAEFKRAGGYLKFINHRCEWHESRGELDDCVCGIVSDYITKLEAVADAAKRAVVVASTVNLVALDMAIVELEK